MMKEAWHVCGNYITDKGIKSIDYFTHTCDNIFDAIKQAQEYGVIDISSVYRTTVEIIKKGE